MTQELPLLDQIVDFATRRQVTLPVFSNVATKLKATANGSYNILEVERSIDSDQALAAEILRAANSAFFVGLSEITTVRMAIVRLGIQQVGNLAVLATEKARYSAQHEEISALLGNLWHHASACALGSEWLARRSGYLQLAEEAFVGGLLHDIGKLFLLRALDGLVREHPDMPIASADLIREVLDSAHVEQGHRLLLSWHFPEVYRTIVRDHHAEQVDLGNIPLTIVRLANQACNKVGLGLRPDSSIDLSAMPESAALGISDVSLAELEIILEDVAVPRTPVAYAGR